MADVTDERAERLASVGTDRAPGPAVQEDIMRTSRLLAVVALISLLFVGCGDDSSGSGSGNGIEGLSAEEILTRTGDAATAKGSVYVSGKGTTDGESIEIDLRVSKTAGATGSITLAGGKMELVSEGTKVYVRADKAFWTAQADAATASLVGNRWVSMGMDGAGFGEFADFDALIGSILEPEGKVTKGGTSTINGQKAISLETSEGKLWVATTGDPLPLKIDNVEGGSINFKDWGKSFSVKVPAAGDVVDLSKLAR